MPAIISSALVGFFLWTPVAGGTPVAPVDLPTYTVSMTAYNAVPEQTDSSPEMTASGAYSNPDIVAARSVDLADELPFGTVIQIDMATSTPDCGFSAVQEQVGLRVIADSMNARMHNKIDLLFDENETVRAGGKIMNPARAFGICKGVTVRVVGKIDIKHIPKTQQDLRLAVGLLEKAGKQQLAVSK